MKIFVIGMGGFLGAILRYFSSKYTNLLFSSSFPYGTLVVNVVGSFTLGYLYTLSVEKLAITENFRMFVGVGFLGAFTTFSTFSVETLNLFEDGMLLLALANVFLNVFFCLVFAYFGIILARV
jgi:CrcB protein